MKTPNQQGLRAGTALAAACASLCMASGGAEAQSVTIYGLIDASVEHLSDVGASRSGLTRVPGLTGSLPSRLGLRGSEDLGGGLKAVFVLEQGIGVDSGTLNQGGRVWGRQAYVGLSGDFGTVALGRQYSMLYWSQLDADLLGPAMFGSGSLDSYLPNSRVDNAMAWRGTFSGWTLGATFSPGRDSVNAGPTPAGTNCPGESATDSKACRQWSAMVKYDTANWGAVAAVDAIRGGTGAFAGLTSSALTDRRATVAGWARWDNWKVGGGLINRRNEGSTTTPKSKLWYVGAGYTVNPQILLEAELFKLDYKNSANQATLLAVRATYTLSKRTALYATAGRIDNDGTLALSVSNAASGGTPPAGGSQNGIATGIKHSF
ncbi:porin [Roseateles sp. SL47]|uniref:porin n=1 Tax=Roseateles sp. SL47 TaxID=2995138 RepID=UPI00226E804D|nr:porin [Roseateles sp. SL47]WAC71376.1 porin [Roseateles sp. SL47]